MDADAVAILRSNLSDAHWLLEQVVEGLTYEQAHQAPPGTANTIAAVLTLRLHLGYGLPWGDAAWSGVFHSISAFNNAGFSIHADSVMRYASDALILLPINRRTGPVAPTNRSEPSPSHVAPAGAGASAASETAPVLRFSSFSRVAAKNETTFPVCFQAGRLASSVPANGSALCASNRRRHS